MGQGGSASLELVALLPTLMIVGLLVLQAGVAVWALTSAGEAARTAARAHGLGLDPAGSARRSLPDSLSAGAITTTFGPGHGVRVTVRVPRVAPVPSFTVSREAVLP